MKRKIHQVRKQIKKRKNMREQEVANSSPWKHKISPMMSEEDKHGFGMPILQGVSGTKGKKKRGRPTANMVKLITSIVLFGCIAFLLQQENTSFSSSQAWLKNNLEQEFPFAQVNKWYVTTFGSPLALAPQGELTGLGNSSTKALPVMGNVVETFSTNGKGIMISPEERSMVSTIEQGIVIFAGNDQATNKTVIVQHPDGSNSTYGFLSSIDIHLYQAVGRNQMIGSFTPSEESEFVYFSIEKDDQYIDPSQVVPVDDVP